jgi:mitogen-activated protein kinase kinase kinase ANP1
MAESTVRTYTRDVLHGLKYLHDKKIMHRDIKGQNVLVDNAGVVKLTDFGASKQIQTVAEVTTNKEGEMSLHFHRSSPELALLRDR